MRTYINLKIIVIASALAFVIAGCASNPNSLRDRPAGSLDFVSTESLPKVFEAIKSQAERCNPGDYKSTFNVQLGVTPVPYTSTTVFLVKSNISADQSRAEIFFIGTNTVTNHYMIIDFSLVGAAGTKIVTRYKYPLWRDSAATVEDWSRGDFKKCWFPG